MGRTKYNNKPKVSNGRPTSYREEYNDIAYDLLANEGYTKEQLAEYFEVSVHTIRNWQRKHDEFFTAIKKGVWDFCSKKVEKSLLNKACGYEYDEVRSEAIILEEGEDGEMYVEKKVPIKNEKTGKFSTNTKLVRGRKVTVTHKAVQPDTAAIVFYLCNRMPDAWKNVAKQIVEGHVEHEHNHNIDLKKLIKAIGKEGIEQLRTIDAQYEEHAGQEDTGQGSRRRLLA